MSEILSYVQPPNSKHIYGCGYKYYEASAAEGSDVTTGAVLFKIDDKADVKFVYSFGYSTCQQAGKYSLKENSGCPYEVESAHRYNTAGAYTQTTQKDVCR